jgi:multidrug efflux pump subunit AcrA (membrane-fusion protein)
LKIWPGRRRQGELTFIDNAVDATTGTILLKATFPNDDRSLWPGQFVQVSLTLSELTNVGGRAVAGGADGTERPVHLCREGGSNGGGTDRSRPALLTKA